MVKLSSQFRFERLGVIRHSLDTIVESPFLAFLCGRGRLTVGIKLLLEGSFLVLATDFRIPLDHDSRIS
jgi:hypothetical protein